MSAPAKAGATIPRLNLARFRPWLEHRWFPFALALIILAAAYQKTFRIWFRGDDFAWLGLTLSIHDVPTFLRGLFQPMAQGTIRFLSERLFFITLTSAFGVNESIPFRAAVFLTQAVNLWLFGKVVWHLTGSRLVAAIAPVLWLLNAGVAVAMCWLTTYNQLLITTFLLAAFWAFVRQRHLLTWILFLLGFGALEINVVLPGLLLAYAILFDRSRWRETLPFFVPSLAFTLFHFFAIPKSTSDPTYQLSFDAGMFPRLWHYFRFSLGPWRYVDFIGAPERWDRLGTPLLTALALAILVYGTWKAPGARRWIGVFALGWFVILLLPVLPLANHVSDYYLVSPSLGIALLFAWGIALAWERHRYAVILVVLPLCVYWTTNWRIRGETIRWYAAQTHAARTVVDGVREARRLHPDDAILLTNIDNLLFWNSIVDDPFRLHRIARVYVAPGGLVDFKASLANEDFSAVLLPPADTRYLLDRELAQVYEFAGDQLRNVTAQYRAVTAARFPSSNRPLQIDVGKAYFAAQLGEGWYPVNNGSRWMAQRATVKLAGPGKPGARLFLSGYCHGEILDNGPIDLRVSANGVQLGALRLTRPNEPFEALLPLPADLDRASDLDILLELPRTFRLPPDQRDLGLVFGRFEIR